MGISQVPISTGNRKWTEIATSTPANTTATLSFTSIPTTYYYLLIRFDQLLTNGDTSPLIRFNSDTGNNYASYNMDSGSSNSVNGAKLLPYPRTTGINIGIWNQSSSYNSGKILIEGANDIWKEISYTNIPTVAAGYGSFKSTGQWTGTAAITQIDIPVGGGTYSGSGTFRLLGSN